MPQRVTGGCPRSTAKIHLRVAQTSRGLWGHVWMQILEPNMGITSLMRGKKNQNKQTNKNPISFRKPQNFFFLYNFDHFLHSGMI